MNLFHPANMSLGLSRNHRKWWRPTNIRFGK